MEVAAAAAPEEHEREEEDDDDYEEQEEGDMDDYNEVDEEEEDTDKEEEEEEMDDGSTAVTVQAPTERRSSTPGITTSGVESTASRTATSTGSNDHDNGDVRMSSSSFTPTVTTTAVAAPPPTTTTTTTDTDDLLVGSGGTGGSGSSADGGDTIAAASTNTSSMMIPAVPTLHTLWEKPYLREIGVEDILSYQLSSAKPGNGVEQLYDPSFETYWQSDGVCQPHWIQIQLPRRLPVTHVALYLDYQLDESYTPRTVQIDTGCTVVPDSSHQWSAAHPNNNQFRSGHDTPVMELHEPVGWCIFPVDIPSDPLDNHPHTSTDHTSGGTIMIPRAHWVRISVRSMHQNGRDTHVRRVALFGQRTSLTVRMPPPPPSQHYKNVASAHHSKMIAEKDNDDHHNEETTTDHEDILLYARTRSTVRSYNDHHPDDSSMIFQPRHFRVDPQSTLFASIR